MYDNAIVTGGLGFIGSNYILHAIKSPTLGRITDIDSLSYGSNPENLREVENAPTYQFVKADLADAPTTMRETANADLVIHFAAESHVDRSISDPTRFLQSNVIGTFNLLEAARNGKVRKFIHISTDEVYGPAPPTETFQENTPLNPSSPYSASKAAAEMLALAYHRTYGLPIVILRCTNNFGPVILGKSSNLIELVEDRLGHDFRYSLNSSRIRQEMGWKPEKTLSTALDETVEWYVQNEKWWKPLLNEKTLSPTPWKEKW